MSQETIPALEWKIDTPTTPGYYWVRRIGTKSKSVILIDKSGELRTFGAQTDKSEFAGPFPKPPHD